MIEQSLRDHLVDTAAVAALIGTRIYPGRLPQDVTFPAVSYQRITGGEENTHSGAGPARALVQIDCWSDDTYGEALSVAEAVRAALSSHRGPMGSARDVTARISNQMDLPEPEPALWRRMIEVALIYEEAA